MIISENLDEELRGSSLYAEVKELLALGSKCLGGGRVCIASLRKGGYP